MSLSCKLLNATIASPCSISEGNHLNHVTCKKKSYMVRDDFSHYLVEVDSFDIFKNGTAPLGNMVVGNLPSQRSAFVNSIKFSF